MDIQQVDYFASLLDFYSELLTQKQRETAKMFFCENLGVSEIAEINNTSRQAIDDLLKRTQVLLLDYENKIHIFEKFSKSRTLLNSLENNVKEKFISIWEN